MIVSRFKMKDLTPCCQGDIRRLAVHLSTGLAVLLSITGSLFAQSPPNVELVFEGAFGIEGSQPRQFFNPRGITVGERGQIIVADSGNDRIQICDDQGNCTTFGSYGTAVGQFAAPSEVAVDSRDRIIVADRDNHRIQVCDQQGNCKAFGRFGTAPGEFSSPPAVAVGKQDRIIVADRGNNRIQIFQVISGVERK